MRGRVLLVVAGIGMLAVTGRADIIRLASGEPLEGKVIEETDEQITVESLGSTRVVAKADIVEWIRGEELRALYDQQAQRVGKSTRNIWRLVMWCRLHGMDEEAESHARALLGVNPNYKPARDFLGYRREGDVWVQADGSPDDIGPQREGPSGPGLAGRRSSVESEWKRRWERVNRKDANELLQLAYWCKGVKYDEKISDVLRELFRISPSHEEGIRLAEEAGLDIGVLRGEASDTSLIVLRRDGREVLGRIVDETPNHVTLDLGEAGRFTYERAEILSRRVLTVEELEYYSQRAELKASDAKGHLALAKWAEEKGLGSYARREAEQVIGLDKNNADARAMLGHVKVDGHWVAREGAMQAGEGVERREDWLKRREELMARVATLIQLMKTETGQAKRDAINEVLAMRHPYAVPGLIHILVNERDPLNVEPAKEALYSIQDREVIQGVEGLADSDSPAVLNDCIEVLGRIRTEDAADALISFLTKTDSRHHQDIFGALESIGSPTIDAALSRGLSATAGPLKEQVISVCGKTRAAGTVPDLIRLQTSENPFKEPAAQALYEIGYPAVPLLIESLKVTELRKQTVLVLRGITDMKLPISYERWITWWKEYVGQR